MKDIVIVQSKTVNNESVPVVINIIDPFTGEDDKREITRPAIFKNFQSQMPLKWARYLIKTYPKEYAIVEAAGETNKIVTKAVETAKEKLQGFKCGYCETEAKSKAGLNSHIRFQHPDKWASKKIAEAELNKPAEEIKEPTEVEIEKPI